jgi:hypothetical protein
MFSAGSLKPNINIGHNRPSLPELFRTKAQAVEFMKTMNLYARYTPVKVEIDIKESYK